MAAMCIEQKLMAVLEINSKVVGFACAIKGALLANHSVITASEVAWWCDPDHRGGKGGLSLLIALEGLARAQGVKYFNMQYMLSSMPKTIEGIYEKLGYSKSEVSYTKVL